MALPQNKHVQKTGDWPTVDNVQPVLCLHCPKTWENFYKTFSKETIVRVGMMITMELRPFIILNSILMVDDYGPHYKK